MCFVHLLCILLFFFTREKVGEDLIPFLRQFKPDLLFISAGFDAHHDDMYHFLDEEDFFWLSKELSAVAYHHGIVSKYKLLLMLVFIYFTLYILYFAAGGKVISILEGGYSLASPIVGPTSAKTHKPHASRGKRSGSHDSHEEDKVKVVEKFAQQPGDGGLVKGTLAHVAALAGMDSWAPPLQEGG